MPSYRGGPLDGMLGYQEGVDPAPDQLAAAAIGPGQDVPGMSAAAPTEPGTGGGEVSASAKFDRILSDARELAASDGNFSEADKLILEKITSLLQQLKASNEKQASQAIAGKMSPAVGQAYA